jgi:large subunit ribosomal protein L17
MRHLKAGRKLNRTSAHRKALFRNMVTALIDNERIRTTLAKAKELRGKVERTITLGKKGTLHARRNALKLVADRDSLSKIFGPLAERYANRPGGYTRVIKLGNRLGDDAPMAFIELVDREVDTSVKDKKKEAGENKKETKNEKTPSKKPEIKATAKITKDEKKTIEKADSKKTPKDKEKLEEKNKKPAKDDSSKKK